MKYLLLLTVLLNFACAKNEFSHHDKIRVLPLGDSITFGTGSSNGGYRGYLFDELGDKYESVGSRNEGNFRENKNEGHPSFRVSEKSGNYGLKENISKWYSGEADIILLHAGVNDLENLYKKPQAATMTFVRLKQLISVIQNNYPTAKIYVAKIIGISNVKNPLTLEQQQMFSNSINEYNSLIETLKGKLQNVTIVNMNEAGLQDEDYTDYEHPNNYGYKKMAQVWLEAITNK